MPDRLSCAESLSDFSIEIGADQDRLPLLVELLDLGDDRVELLALRSVDEVRFVVPDHRLVRRDDDDLELVDLVELGGLGVGRSRHAGELLVHPEVVLEGDRREGLVLRFDLHAFLRLDGLVQAVRPAAARHEPARELVDDDDLAVLDHVVDVRLVEPVRANALGDRVKNLHVVRVVEILHAEELLRVRDALLGEDGGLLLLVDLEIDLGVQARDDPVDVVVLLDRFLRGAADDERRARLVDEDRVDLVDDRVDVPRAAPSRSSSNFMLSRR